jgi:hypothetical protein
LKRRARLHHEATSRRWVRKPPDVVGDDLAPLDFDECDPGDLALVSRDTRDRNSFEQRVIAFTAPG